MRADTTIRKINDGVGCLVSRSPLEQLDDSLLQRLEHFGLSNKSEGRVETRVSDIRQGLHTRLASSGVPSSKLEDWKYTNLKKSLKQQFIPCATDLSSLSATLLPASSYENKLLFINGGYDEKASSFESPYISILNSLDEIPDLWKDVVSQQINNSESFSLIADAICSEYVIVDVPENKSVSLEISRIISNGIASKGAQSAKSPDEISTIPYRLFIRAKKGSSISILEDFRAEGEASYLTLHSASIIAEEGSQVVYSKLQRESAAASHYSYISAVQEQKSIVKTVSFNFGASVVRNEIHPVLNGQYGEAWLIGANVVSGTQHVDNFTVIDHASPDCESHELYKGMYGGKSVGAFSGTIVVRKEAQKTNAYQSNASLLCSPDAESNSKPQLKIWADDVKCSHGATVGQLDDEALFYLQSRGVPIDQAKIILTRAYVADVLSHIEDQTLRSTLELLLEDKLVEVLDG